MHLRCRKKPLRSRPSNMTTDKERELEQLVEAAIPYRAKDCPVERNRKVWQRKQLVLKIKAFVLTI